MSEAAGANRVQVFTRPGCHLCDVAMRTVADICVACGVGWIETSIADDAELTRRYTEMVPVVMVDGVQHDYWRVDPARLRAALESGR